MMLMRHDMFTEEYRCFADGAGLFVLPAPLHGVFPPSEDNAGTSIALLKSLEGCLWMYRTQDWEVKIYALRQQLDDQQRRLLMRYMVAPSMPSSVDSKGRLAIPPPLLEFANINDEVVLIGLYDRLELWSPMRREEYPSRLEDQHTFVLEKDCEPSVRRPPSQPTPPPIAILERPLPRLSGSSPSLPLIIPSDMASGL
jgi:MraZ protein